jgi:hypothetical protein
MSTTTSLRSRVEVSPLAAGLVIGDAAALSVFFTLGAESHGFRPFANPAVVAEGVAPFLLTWMLAATVTGLYASSALTSPARALSVAVPAWILAALAGHGLRATQLFRGSTAWTFILVSLVVGGVLVVGWRALAGLVYSRR